MSCIGPSKFAGLWIKSHGDGCREESMLRQEPTEVVIESMEQRARPIVRMFTEQAFKFALHARNGERACDAVANDIDQ